MGDGSKTEAGKSAPKARLRGMWVVLGYVARYPGMVAISVGLLLVVIGLELCLPQVLGSALTQLRWHEAWGAEFEPGVYASLLVSLALARAGLAWVLGPIRNRLIQGALADLRGDVFDAIQRLTFQYHDRIKTGELISRSTTDVWRLQDFFFACLFLSVDILVTMVVTLVLIFAANVLLGWVAVGTLVGTVSLVAFYAGRLHARWRKTHDLHGAMTTLLQENISGVRVVRAFAQESAELARFRKRRDDFLAGLMDAVNYWAMRVPFAQFLFGLGLPLTLWLGGRAVALGRMALGDLAKVVFYLMAIGHRMGMLGQFTNIMQNASASADRVVEILKEPVSLPDGVEPLPSGSGAVRFEDVTFEYTDGKASLFDVNFDVRGGETVAIVGPTGSGKTTLVNLLPRFYDPARGRVLVDGVDIRRVKIASLRRSVGFIFQDTFLFTASVAENIAFGRPDASRAEVEAAARVAQAHEFIGGLENGYDTVIGERGVTLSGGQRQRLAIARAFLLNPRILVLDDATASVDGRTERLIQQALKELCAGRTTFVIAHRVTTVERADRILVLREGRLVEHGTHAELLARGGFYTELFQRELGEAASTSVSPESTDGLRS